jgi:hypothetical protein
LPSPKAKHRINAGLGRRRSNQKILAGGMGSDPHFALR